MNTTELIREQAAARAAERERESRAAWAEYGRRVRALAASGTPENARAALDAAGPLAVKPEHVESDVRALAQAASLDGQIRTLAAELDAGPSVAALTAQAADLEREHALASELWAKRRRLHAQRLAARQADEDYARDLRDQLGRVKADAPRVFGDGG